MTMKSVMVNKRELHKSGPENTINENLSMHIHKSTVETKSDEVDYDELLSSAGEFGKYQVILFFSTFPFYIFGVFVYYSQLFMTEVSPNHWCWIPELENLTDAERRNLAIPRDVNTRFGYSHCLSYDANWTEVLTYGLTPDESWNTKSCQYGWEFNKTEIPYPTISTDQNWVCERDSYQATAQAAFFVGSIVGGFVIGWISDKFGRLPALISSNVIGCIGGLASTFSINFVMFATCRFIMGMSYDNCMMMAYLIVLEYVAPKYRSLMSNMSFALFYAAAATALPYLALVCGHWKYFSLVTSLPLLLAVFSPLFLPESPRWLLAKGKIENAIQKVLTIGRINKKEVPLKVIEQFRLSIQKTKPKKVASIVEVFKRPVLRRMFICICIEYMCCTIVFDGLRTVLPCNGRLRCYQLLSEDLERQSFISVVTLQRLLSPYVIYLENYVYWLPLAILSIIAAIGAIIAFALPETAKKDMPNTFEDAEELIRSQKLWDFPCIAKNAEVQEQINESCHI
ncbi:hypothetical protein ACJJTC_003341 [Scirpophaga incertulas]